MVKVFRWKTCRECPFVDSINERCKLDEDLLPNMELWQEPPEDCPIESDEIEVDT